MAEIDDLNTTDASNTGRFAENIAPSALNNGARALEGMIARWVQHHSGENFNAGTESGVNSLTVSIARGSFTNSTTSTKYIDGLTLLVTIPSTLTGAALMSINGHTKKPLIGPDGVSLSTSAILGGQKVLFNWDNDALSDVGGWRALTTIGRPGAVLGANTFTGTQSFADQILSRPEIKDYAETVNALGSLGGGTDDIDLVNGNVVSATVDTGTETFTFSNPPGSGKAGSFTLILTNGGSQTVNWPASVDWAGGSAPSLTSAGVDVLTFITTDGGTTWLGFVSGLDMS